MKNHKDIKKIAVFLTVLVAAGIIFAVIYHAVKVKPESVVINTEYRDFGEISKEQFNNGKRNICLITKGYGTDYWETLIQGVADAAAEEDINLYVAGVAQESNTDILANLMETALEMEPDAIIVSPADTARINEIAQKIDEKNIPLIFVDTILNGKYFDACFMTDNMQAGRLLAREMVSKLRNAGHNESDSIMVGIDIGSEKSQTIIERLAGFNEYWSNYAPKNWTVIDDIKINGGNIDVAQSQCLEFIDGYDKLAGLIGLNNGSTVGICRGIVERDRKDLVIVGFDYSDEMAALIADKDYYAATMVQLQYDMGYGSVKTAVDICQGKESEFKFFNTGVSIVDNKNYNSPHIRKNVLRK